MKRKKYATFAEKSLKMNMLMLKNIVKQRSLSFFQVNTEVLHTAYAIQNVLTQ